MNEVSFEVKFHANRDSCSPDALSNLRLSGLVTVGKEQDKAYFS